MDSIIETNAVGTDDYVKTDDILNDMREIIDDSQKRAYQIVNLVLVRRNWLIGRRIAEEELNGDKRAKYGNENIKNLADSLTKIYGKGFDYSSLYKFVKFYKYFPNILDSMSPKFNQLLS